MKARASLFLGKGGARVERGPARPGFRRSIIQRARWFAAASLSGGALPAAVTGSHSAFDPAGPQARSLWSLTHLLTWGCLAVYVVVMTILVVALIRRRDGPPPRERLPEQARHRLNAWVIGGLGVSALVLFGFLAASLRTDRKLNQLEGGPDVVTVRVTGKQWWWELNYEDNEPGKHFVTANELHVPVGRPVLLKLQTADVIHSLWIPSLQGKKDLVPGRENTLWLKVDRPGTYAGQCAEFCGLQHAHMSLLVVAESNEAFEAWCVRQRSAARPPDSESAKRGQGVFLGSTCVMCHTVRGTPASSRAGPDLTHFASRRTLAAASLPNERKTLAAWIRDPQQAKPGTRMPAHAFTEEELQPLLDYLEGLK